MTGIHRRRSAFAIGLALATGGSALAISTQAQAGPPTDPANPASFARVNVDTAITGAAFTVQGSVFGTEMNLVTSGFGAFTGGPPPTPPAAGTLQVYRPGANLGDWTKVSVFTEAAAITFPNQPTIADVDGDADNDLIVPGGYFFDTYDPPAPGDQSQNRGSLTWWENTGPTTAFVRHDILLAQPWAYHGVQFADVDGDTKKDIVTVGEQAKSPSDPADDLVELQILHGNGDGTFDAPVALSATGGSLPVVYDVNGDSKLDIVSAQYFGFPNGPAAVTVPSFRWYEQVGAPGVDGVTAANFETHTIATFASTAYGFQIVPVPDLHGDGEVAWVATNHMSKAGPGGSFIPAFESVYELTPGSDIEAPWTVTTLSNPADPADKMAARAAAGSAAPGVLGAGDIDGDGDIDLAVSGDGDEKVVGGCVASNTCARRLFWIEQHGDGTFEQHTLTSPTERFGQAGGAVVADLDGDGANELAFSSFERNALAIWKRAGGGEPEPADVTTTVTGFKTKARTLRKGSVVRDTITVTPGAGRPVVLEYRTCPPTSSACTWTSYAAYSALANGRVRLVYAPPSGKSWWRVAVAATDDATQATTGVRKLTVKKKK